MKLRANVTLLVGGACIAFLVAGCATPSTTGPATSAEAVEAERLAQEEFVLREMVAVEARVQSVAADVLAANAKWCGERVEPRIGIMSMALSDLDEGPRKIAERANIVPAAMTVWHVVRGGSADAAGVQVGDEIVSVNGVPLPSTKPGVAFSKATASADEVEVELARASEHMTVKLVPQPACNVPVVVVWDEQTNAYTDGEKIVVLKGMVDLTKTDDELGTVLGHELAHVLSGHIEAKKANAMGGMAAGLVADVAFAALGVNTGGAFTKAGGNIGATAYSQDFEREADYVGAYFAHAAGYDSTSAPLIWRRMSSVDPKQLTYAGTHPTSPERFVALSETASEIARKQQGGEPLVPSNWVPGGNLPKAEPREQPAFPN